MDTNNMDTVHACSVPLRGTSLAQPCLGLVSSLSELDLFRFSSGQGTLSLVTRDHPKYIRDIHTFVIRPFVIHTFVISPLKLDVNMCMKH